MNMNPLKCSWVWYGHLVEFAVAWLIVQVTCIKRKQRQQELERALDTIRNIPFK